ncbi:MAG: dienelactone hydrolase family protein [Deltaproteobacteria bacterium]|nr:dienelactone hydrolase family protein [Deltaproteobacteria bacterium]
MAHETHALTNADGTFDLHVFTPAGAGPWPAVFFCMDGGGVRPTLFAMCERLAANGYLVALPDLFHRSGKYDPTEVFAMVADPARRPHWFQTYFLPATKMENFKRDAECVLNHLSARADVLQARLGTVGYCLGGNLALKLAGLFGARVSAAASFHGGGLAADSPDSPHTLAAQMKARLYIGAATDDGSFPEAMKDKLVATLTAAGVQFALETYPARHGFAIEDHYSGYDRAAADRHWATLLQFFAETLKT